MKDFGYCSIPADDKALMNLSKLLKFDLLDDGAEPPVLQLTKPFCASIASTMSSRANQMLLFSV